MNNIEKNIKMAAALYGTLTDVQIERLNVNAVECGACDFPIVFDFVQATKDLKIPLFKCGACNCKKTLDIKTITDNEECPKKKWTNINPEAK